ncbi:MAG: hypothetical protein HZB43_00800 [candidate division Zixibacteria bacterium]|nr:hypothetical protein [candidate division Zixibacteria bacterium]
MTLSNCPKGRVWDAFVLGLPGVDVSFLTSHLDGCEDCRFLVSDRRSYYSSLSSEARGSIGDVAARIIPVPLKLTPLSLVEISSRVESVMAAAGPAEQPSLAASTFASDDRRWMVKAVWDSTTDHEKLYVMSSEGSTVAGLLVRLSGLAVDYVTDAKGCVDLGGVRWPMEANPHVIVTSPAATFSLKAAVLPEQRPSSALLKSGHNDVLKVTISHAETSRSLRLEIVALAPDLAGKPLRVAVQSATGSQLLNLEPVMVLDDFELPGALDIYLFA